MSTRHRTAGLLPSVLALSLAASVPALVLSPAHAGTVGPGETIVSGTTTSAGVGEAVAAALPDGRTLVVWEGIRATANGSKREIWGRLLETTGVPAGSPVLLAQMGGAEDASQDAADPAVAPLPDGTVALVFAGDVVADAGSTDTTSWQVRAGIVDPNALGLVTPVALTTGTDTAYDQQHPDVSVEDGALRVVWDGDTAATGDGNTAIWTARVPANLSGGAPTPMRVTVAGSIGLRPRVASLTATAQSAIVWEAVGGTGSGTYRRVGAARVAGTTEPTAVTGLGIGGTSAAVQEQTPDIAAGAADYRVVWSSNSAGSYGISTARLDATTTIASGTAITSGAQDTWPSVVVDAAGSGDFVVDFARRTSTAGSGHYEVMSRRFTTVGDPTEPLQQVSSVDGDMSFDNIESMRPAVAAHANGAFDHAWSRLRLGGTAPGVAVRRTMARVDLSTSLTVSPSPATPLRPNIHTGTTVTATLSYRNASASERSVPARITLDFPGFTASGTSAGSATQVSPSVWTTPALAPGATGTITLTGAMDPGADGTVRLATATIAAEGVAVDDPATDNTSTASVVLQSPPYVTGISRIGSTPTNQPAQWKIDFSEAVTGFDSGDVVLTAAGEVSVSSIAVSCSGLSCTVTASGTGTADLVLRVPASATARDSSNRDLATLNLPAVSPTTRLDTVAPTVSLIGPLQDPTNASPIPFSLEFSELVGTLDQSRLQVTGGTIGTISGSGLTRTVTVVPSGDGDVSLRALAALASDPAGNASTGSTTVTRRSDRTAPVVTLTGPETPQRTAYDVTVSASETVTGLTRDAFTVANGTIESFTGTGPWTVRVQPATDGTVTLRLPADAVTDAAGNRNVASSSSTTYDATRPSVTVSSAAADRTGDNPIVFTLDFSEPVTGLTVDELTVNGGTATLTGSGATRRVEVVPSGQGPVSVAVPADAAVDAAGNTSTAGAAVTRTYDTTGPTPQLGTSVGSPTNAASFPVTVTWPEDVTGFGPGDLSVTNGTPSDLVAGQGNTWTFTVTPTSDGPVEVSIPAAAAQDLAGNSSLASTPLRVVSDRTAPIVAFSSSADPVTNDASITVDVTFSESVTGLTDDDFVTDNATISGLTGSSTLYRLTLTPNAEGVFGLRLPAGAAVDAAGNSSGAGAASSWTYDATATATLTYTGADLVNAPIALTLTLSDDATITAGDFETDNGTVTSVSGSGRTWDLVLTPTADGDASVRLPAGAWTDEAGNANTASATVEVTYDGTSPTVTDLAVPALATAPYDVDVTFSEPVATLSLAQVTVTNGSAGQLTGSGTDWTFVVTPSADGVVTVAVGADAARDAAGNASVASGTASTTYDSTAPTVTVDSPSATVVTTSPIPVEVRFSEPVTGFDLADVQVGNGTLTNLAGGGNRWTADLVPAAEGTVTMRIVAGAAVDQTGHPSEASNTLSREFDSTRPTLALTSPVSGTTTTSTIPVTATFSKAVLGFTQDDLRVSGATVTGFTKVDQRTWTFDLVATTDGEVSVTVPEKAAASAGGHLAFGASYAVTVDRTAPVLAVTGPAGTTEGLPVTFDLVASEAVTGLDEADLSVSGSAGAGPVVLTPGPANTWKATVSGMTATGDVTLAIRAGAVADAAGTTSAAASGTASWRPAGRLTSFTLLQRPGNREGNRVALPVEVVGSDVTFTATSSNPKVLPASAISVTGTGTMRQLTLAGRPEAAGASRVVVTATAGSVTRTVTLRFVVDGDGDERLVGTRGIDVMLARHGDDVLLGKGGDDHLYGGFGDDRIVGGTGDDVLVGGPGADTMVGGKGADLFVAWGKDDLVDRSKKQGDRVLHPSKAERRLLGP